MNKIKLFTYIILSSIIYSANTQTVYERERLIGESYYRWDYNKGLLPSDSTIYFYNNQNNIVTDPYKTYLKKSFDSIEAFHLDIVYILDFPIKQICLLYIHK